LIALFLENELFVRNIASRMPVTLAWSTAYTNYR
jgi:hypothetical protein